MCIIITKKWPPITRTQGKVQITVIVRMLEARATHEQNKNGTKINKNGAFTGKTREMNGQVFQLQVEQKKKR